MKNFSKWLIEQNEELVAHYEKLSDEDLLEELGNYDASSETAGNWKLLGTDADFFDRILRQRGTKPSFPLTAEQRVKIIKILTQANWKPGDIETWRYQ